MVVTVRREYEEAKMLEEQKRNEEIDNINRKLMDISLKLDALIRLNERVLEKFDKVISKM